VCKALAPGGGFVVSGPGEGRQRGPRHDRAALAASLWCRQSADVGKGSRVDRELTHPGDVHSVQTSCSAMAAKVRHRHHEPEMGWLVIRVTLQDS